MSNTSTKTIEKLHTKAAQIKVLSRLASNVGQYDLDSVTITTLNEVIHGLSEDIETILMQGSKPKLKVVG